MVLFIQKALPFFPKQVHNPSLKWYKPLNIVRMQVFHLSSPSPSLNLYLLTPP